MTQPPVGKQREVLQMFQMYVTDAMQTPPHYSKFTLERQERKVFLRGTVTHSYMKGRFKKLTWF